jgi:CubicO group peptidase (beta-lactamase class C family)
MGKRSVVLVCSLVSLAVITVGYDGPPKAGERQSPLAGQLAPAAPPDSPGPAGGYDAGDRAEHDRLRAQAYREQGGGRTPESFFESDVQFFEDQVRYAIQKQAELAAREAAEAAEAELRAVQQAERAVRDAALDAMASAQLGDRPYQVVVAKDGQVVAQATNAGAPQDPQRAASVSKVITAVAVFALIDRGFLSLDTPVLDVLPLSGAHPGYASATIADLLSHRAGIPFDTDPWFDGSFQSCNQAATWVLSKPPASRGTFRYSNTNTCVLSLVIEKITGLSYRDAASQLVFEPLNLQTPPFDDAYLRLSGAGAWQLSPADTAVIVSALDPSLPDSPLLSQWARTTMASPTSDRYGYGYWYFGQGIFGHSGTLNSARNLVVRLPDGETIAVFTQANFPGSGLGLYDVALALADTV